MPCLAPAWLWWPARFSRPYFRPSSRPQPSSPTRACLTGLCPCCTPPAALLLASACMMLHGYIALLSIKHCCSWGLVIFLRGLIPCCRGSCQLICISCHISPAVLPPTRARVPDFVGISTARQRFWRLMVLCTACLLACLFHCWAGALAHAAPQGSRPDMHGSKHCR